MEMATNITANVSQLGYLYNSSAENDYPEDKGDDYFSSDEYISMVRAAKIYELFTQPQKLIALILGFFAVSLNILSLLAMSQIKNRITSHHRLIISLAISDMLIGVTVVLHFIVIAFNINYFPGYGPPEARLQSRCLFMATKALNSTGLNISLLNLMGMAIDHYMAIIRPLHYPSQMNRRKASIMITFLWVTAIILGFSDFLTGVKIYGSKEPRYNYCEATFISLYQDEYVVFAITFIASGVMTYIYTRIYIKIKRHRIPGERHVSKESLKRSSLRKDINKSKRALITTLLILGSFMICWLPNCLYQIALVIQVQVDKKKLLQWQKTLKTIDEYFVDLLVVNSITDPIIYAVRMYDVQLGYKRLIRKCFRRSSWVEDTQSQCGTRFALEKRTSQQNSRPTPGENNRFCKRNSDKSIKGPSSESSEKDNGDKSNV